MPVLHGGCARGDPDKAIVGEMSNQQLSQAFAEGARSRRAIQLTQRQDRYCQWPALAVSRRCSRTYALHRNQEAVASPMQGFDVTRPSCVFVERFPDLANAKIEAAFKINEGFVAPEF